MKKNILLLTLLAFLISCSSTKNYSGKTNADAALQNTVQLFNNNPQDEKARQALPGLYADVQHAHLVNIKKFKAKNKDRSPYWMDIISEYQSLQNTYNSIANSAAAYSVVTPLNYELSITKIKEEAAKHYYQLGESLVRKEGRINAQKALEVFTLCNYYVPGYEGIKSNLDMAHARAVTNIVINPFEDHSRRGKANSGDKEPVSFGDLFQQYLKTNLHEDFLNSIRPVAFYTDKEAAANNIKGDLVISLELRSIDVTVSSSSSSSPLVVNNPAAPGGYVAENIVTYNPPVDGKGVGPQPWYPQSFGNKDVFTYPPTPSAPTAVYSANHDNPDFFINGVLSVIIMDKNLRQNISSEMLTKSVHLSNYPVQSSGQIINDSVIVQKFFDKFYSEIKQSVSNALN